MIYSHERTGRRPTNIAALLGIWIGLALLWIGLDVAWWLLVLVGAATLPLLFDILKNRRSRIEIWPGRIVWASALGSGDSTDVDHVRLNRRFDGSIRLTLVHAGGAQTRLPPDIAPPVAPLLTALSEANIATQQHPFSPF